MLTIALHQGALVVLFFMAVRWSSRLTWVVAASGFVWLLILFGITMSDYMSRGWMVGIASLSSEGSGSRRFTNPQPAIHRQVASTRRFPSDLPKGSQRRS